MTSEHWQEKRKQTKNNMEEDNDIRARCSWSASFSLASALMLLSSSMLYFVCLLFSCQCSDVKEEDNNIRALAREKEADQEQHERGQ
jgi:hypothetical protein